MAGLYVHIPFCGAKCSYCDFYSLPPSDGDIISRYIDRVIDEYRRRQNEFIDPITTVYVGGGTPGIVPPPLLDRLFEALPSDNIEEYTIETNPELISREWLSWLRNTPVNRLSIGIQSLNDAELKIVGRRATAAQNRAAMDAVEASHIRNFNYDLIFGLPGQSERSWSESLNEVIARRPPHLSAYMLSWEEGTRLNAMRVVGKVQPLDDDMLLRMYDLLCDNASRAGYDHYEISNFAQPQNESRHNSSYWDGTPYLGIGVAAHSFDGRIRRANSFGLRRYLDGENPVVDVESADEQHNDMLLTALRTVKGVDRKCFTEKFGPEAWNRILRLIAPYVESGRMWRGSDAVGMTETGWMLTDAILIDLFR